MKLQLLDRTFRFSTLLLIGALCPTLVHAGWGSLQGNNRSAPAASRPAAPRAQPAAAQTQSRPDQHIETQPAQRPENFSAPPAPRPEEHPQPQPVIRDQAHEVHVDNVYHPAPEEVSRARDDQADRQRLDIGEERRQSAFWSDFHAGMRLDRLPDGYRRIGVRGHPYFYFQGVYYDNGPSGYVVIAPPVDAIVSELPPGTETVVLGDTYFYYAAGAFYVQQADGTFIVVAAPVGVTVSTLPPDATPIEINGMTCYQADGAYYEPVMFNGTTGYLTIPPP